MSFFCKVATLVKLLWPIRAFHIYPHYPIKGKILGGKNLLNIKHLVWSSVQLLSETFPILRRTELDMIKKFIYVFM